MTKERILFILFFIFTLNSLGQNIPIYTQYIVNPYISNPAYAGLEGKPSAALTYRKQWFGITDAPVTTNFVFHTPLFAGLNMGLNVTQDNYGIFSSSSALLTVGYTLGLGWNHYISFGMSGGAGFQNIDYTNVNINDPALTNLLNKNTYLDGNVGFAYHKGNLNIGIALPRIFDTQIYPTESFDAGTLGLIRNYIITTDYMVYFADENFAFQPYALYRSYAGYTPQIEGGGIFHIKNLLWAGGSYRQNFGIAGLAGVKVNGNFSFGYSYEIPTTKASNINKTSHELQLTFSFGEKNNRSKKHATFLASNKPVKEKKKKEEVAKKEEIKEEKTEKKEVVAKKEEPKEEKTEKKEEVAKKEEPKEKLKDEKQSEEEKLESTTPIKDIEKVSTDIKIEETKTENTNSVPIEKVVNNPIEKVIYNTPIDETVEKTEVTSTSKTKVKDNIDSDIAPFLTTTSPSLEVKPPKKDTKINSNKNNDLKPSLEPAIIAKKGNHPFELNTGHYVVVGVFGVFKNAVSFSDQAQAKGYNTEYGYNSEKKLFYVVIHYADSPEITRQKRDELRKNSQFSKAWYLLVE